jgi:thioredoxin 1
MIHTFQDSEWEDKISKEEIVCVQFSASWCAPCRSLSPVLEKLSEHYPSCKFYYGDVENNAINQGSVMGIRGVPSTIIFRKGKEIDRLVGFPGEAKVKEWLDKSL